MNDFVASLIRTYIPIIVAAVVTWAAGVGVIVPDDVSTALATFLGGTAGAVYYALIRVLEQRYPAIGNLLGVAKKPNYDAKPGLPTV